MRDVIGVSKPQDLGVPKVDIISWGSEEII